MKKNIKFFLFFCIFITFLGSNVWAGRVQWIDYNKGLAKAKTEKKPILLNFFANWCGYCVKMEKETFSDRTVANFLNDTFVPIRVNSDKEPRISAMYGVRGLPYFWFLTDKGERIASIPGFIPASMFINYLRYIQTSSYQKMDFNQFMLQKKTDKTKK